MCALGFCKEIVSKFLETFLWLCIHFFICRKAQVSRSLAWWELGNGLHFVFGWYPPRHPALSHGSHVRTHCQSFVESGSRYIGYLFRFLKVKSTKSRNPHELKKTLPIVCSISLITFLEEKSNFLKKGTWKKKKKKRVSSGNWTIQRLSSAMKIYSACGISAVDYSSSRQQRELYLFIVSESDWSCL